MQPGACDTTLKAHYANQGLVVSPPPTKNNNNTSNNGPGQNSRDDIANASRAPHTLPGKTNYIAPPPYRRGTASPLAFACAGGNLPCARKLG